MKFKISTITLSSLFLMLGISGSAFSNEQDKITWKCSETSKNSMQCLFENQSSGNSEVCFDVVKICKNGDHNAHLCSGKISPGGSENKVIRAFEPKIKLFESCMGTEFRNKVITH